MFLEAYARWLMVLHTVAAVALVASSTHLVVWMRGYLRGRFARHAGVRKFAYIAASLFAVTFILGNLLYPTYKVRVRMQYLENPTAVAREFDQRAADGAVVEQRHRRSLALRDGMAAERVTAIEVKPDEVDGDLASRAAARIARWFDVKEHWVAMGLALSLACAVIVTFWDPRRGGKEIVPIVFGLAVAAAATTWVGAIIGLLTASYRAVG